MDYCKICLDAAASAIKPRLPPSRYGEAKVEREGIKNIFALDHYGLMKWSHYLKLCGDHKIGTRYLWAIIRIVGANK